MIPLIQIQLSLLVSTKSHEQVDIIEPILLLLLFRPGLKSTVRLVNLVVFYYYNTDGMEVIFKCRLKIQFVKISFDEDTALFGHQEHEDFL